MEVVAEGRDWVSVVKRRLSFRVAAILLLKTRSDCDKSNKKRMPEHIRHNCFVVGVRIIIEAVSARDLHSHGISFEFLNTMCEPGQFGTTIQVKMQKGKATVGHEKFRLPGERIYGRGGKTARRWRAVNSREGGISGS